VTPRLVLTLLVALVLGACSNLFQTDYRQAPDLERLAQVVKSGSASATSWAFHPDTACYEARFEKLGGLTYEAVACEKVHALVLERITITRSNLRSDNMKEIYYPRDLTDPEYSRGLHGAVAEFLAAVTPPTSQLPLALQLRRLQDVNAKH
jgi:hypothetical protein